MTTIDRAAIAGLQATPNRTDASISADQAERAAGDGQGVGAEPRAQVPCHPPDPLVEAQAVVDQLCGEDNGFAGETAKALLVGYDARWRKTHDEMLLQHVEAELVAPLASVNPPVQSETWQIGGRLDKIVRDRHGTCLYDHKTTSQAIDDPHGNFWRGLQIDSQHQHYELLAWLNGVKFDRIVWDVVRKPTIRPRRLSGGERDALAATRRWQEIDVSEVGIEESIRSGRESVELFGARVAAEVLKNPDRYFVRRTVVRSRPELAEYADELYQIGESMEQARRLGRHYRNASACFQYGAPCEYLDICSGHDREDSDNWQQTTAVHRELDTIEQGHELITHSRLQCFLTCRRKHYYRYELGLDRVEPAERDALFFGRVWHAALDVYWQLSCNGEA